MFGVVALICALIFLYYSRRFLASRAHKEKLKNAISQRLQYRSDQFERIRRTVENELFGEQIHHLSLSQLINVLRDRKFTAVQVLRAYQRKAIDANEQTNCVTLFIEEAEKWAKILDHSAENPNYIFPPLFGVPFSLKESTSVRGYDQTLGFAKNLDKFANEDAEIVKQIKKLGGVPFVLTNVPQSLLAFTCINPIYGVTKNAFSPDRTPGGSTGGEASLIACNGSIIGIGSDSAGSLRLPAHFSGIACLKPSSSRFNRSGSATSIPGRLEMVAALGPMTKRIDDAITFCRIFWSERWSMYDNAYVPPVYWNEQWFSSQLHLRIGYYDDDGWFTPTPAVQRAILMARTRLENVGHELIKFEVPDINMAFKLLHTALLLDGGKYISNEFNEDVICDGFQQYVMLMSSPIFLRRFLARLTRPFYPRISTLLSGAASTINDLREVYQDIANYRQCFIRLMRDSGIDAILCPVHVSSAIGHLYPLKLFPTVSYSAFFNLLDFAAGTVKITEVCEEDEASLNNFPSTDIFDGLLKKAAEGSIGLPIGVQVAAPPFHEEIVLRLLSELENSVER